MKWKVIIHAKFEPLSVVLCLAAPYKYGVLLYSIST
jgi:hypothetical protein